MKEKAIVAIGSISAEKIQDYKDYWELITPQDDEEYYWRWVFSFLSVHTTWQSNAFGYLLLRENKFWWENEDSLENKIIEARVGLHKRRTKGIFKFTKDFWTNPEFWKKREDETWAECRDRLAKECNGLGLAKTAFALEMCYPNTNESVCLDTHMLQLYGYMTENERRKACKPEVYKEIEQHWVTECKSRDVPTYIARSLFWDAKQKKEDSRYWSCVFE